MIRPILKTIRIRPSSLFIRSISSSGSTMPKDTLPPLPLSGLFAVAKPSGQTSMSVVNDIKNLINGSSLFIEASKLQAAKGKPDKRRKRSNKDMAKIGQGGTLDPLAGTWSLMFLYTTDCIGFRWCSWWARFLQLFSTSILTFHETSCWDWKRYQKTIRIPRLCQGMLSCYFDELFLIFSGIPNYMSFGLWDRFVR